jgi:hypothetical protein
MPELNAQEKLNLQSNAANGTPVMELVGTGAHETPSTLTLATNPAGTTTIAAGHPITFVATVGTGANTATPGGSIKFFVNGSQVGSAPVSNDTASITLNNGLPTGAAVTVTATYTGDVINYSGSTASLTLNVTPLSDSLTLAIAGPVGSFWTNPYSANDITTNAAGPAITLTATLTPSYTIIPGGTVTFYAGSTALGTVSVTPGSGVFTAVLTTTALRAGTTTQVENGSFTTTYNLTAVYSGDATYLTDSTAATPIAIVAPYVIPPACATTTPATCELNTTGAYFTLTPTNPTITAAANGGPSSGSTTLSINSYGGWSGILNFTCSGLPKYASCNPYPGYPSGIPSSPTAVATPTSVDFIINTNQTPIKSTGSMIWWVSGILGFMLLVMRRRVKLSGYLRAGQLFTLLGAALLLTGSAIGMSGCSTSTYTYITPAGSYTINVAVSAAQLNPALQSSEAGATYPPDTNVPGFQITLVVQ